jgi:HEPN domain-containing protein
MDNKHKIFLEIASEDLDSSKLLFTKKKFPQAVFFFEQSVEKTCKYLLLNQEILTVDQLNKKVRHNSIVVFKLYSKFIIEGISSLIDVNNNKPNSYSSSIISPPEVVSDLQSGISEFEGISNGRYKELDQSAIDKKLYLLKQFSGGLDFTTKYSGFFNSDPETLFGYLSNFIILNDEEKMALQENLKNEKFKNELFQKIKKALDSTKENARIEQTLMVLAQIFSSHSERTRYPDNDLKIYPISLYSMTNTLVKNLKSFYPYQEMVLSYMKKN